MTTRHVLSPDLTRALETADGPLLVVATFSAQPAPAVLQEFGLDALPGRQAAGALRPDAIRRLAKRADVRAIDLQKAATMPTVAANPKLDTNLSALFNDDRDELYTVGVTFRTPPSADTVRAAGLVAIAPDSRIAAGRLSKRAILELAGRDDVVYVEYQRPPQPSVN
jgi:hypothetical protein